MLARERANTSQLHHCGQFTFYFPKCLHATSHTFHLNTWSGLLCNKNCVYDKSINYWFYADEPSLCSWCGLSSSASGIGTKQILPPEKEREKFFEALVKSGKLSFSPGTAELRQIYETLYSGAVTQYNMLIDRLPSLSSQDTNKNLTQAQKRAERRNRFHDRWDIRRFRARRRTEEWVNNIREEQYQAMKDHIPVAQRPYIVTPTGNPHMDLYLPSHTSPPLEGDCAWCQYPLMSHDATKESGKPHRIPCGHSFHYICIISLFEKRAQAGEKEVHKCPLCSTCFVDVREIPDFWGRYRGGEREWGSEDGSSVLSGSEVGDLRGKGGPPWFEDFEDSRAVVEEGKWLRGGRERSLDECMKFVDEVDRRRGQTGRATLRAHPVREDQNRVIPRIIPPPAHVAGAAAHREGLRARERVVQPVLPPRAIGASEHREGLRARRRELRASPCENRSPFDRIVDGQVTNEIPSDMPPAPAAAAALDVRRTGRRRREPRRWDDEYAERNGRV